MSKNSWWPQQPCLQVVLAHHSLEGILDQALLIIAEDTGHARLTDNQETMVGEEEEMVRYILLVEAFILRLILLHPEEIQGPVTMIAHIVDEEDLEIGKEHLATIKEDQMIGKEDQGTERVSPEIEVDHKDNEGIHLVVETIGQGAIIGMIDHKDLQEIIMDQEEGMMVGDQRHQIKIIVGGVAVQII